MQNWRRWRNADHPRNSQEGRWVASRRLNLKIENLLYRALVIEVLDWSGPMRLPALSVCHYANRTATSFETRSCALSLDSETDALQVA